MILEDKLREVYAEYLHRMRQGDNQLLQQVEMHVTSRQGKMLRPSLLLLAADTLGQADTRRTLLLSVCIEILHNASLLHDDVIDHDALRRGQASVNARWGDAVAILVGDFFMAQIMMLLSEVGEAETTAAVSNTVMRMVDAELTQQEHHETNPDTYLRIIDGKTAQLFATAAQLGNPKYREFGLHYGRLFQIYDDLRDGEVPPFYKELIQKERGALVRLQAEGKALDIADPATFLQ